uniref:Uncharacterized protein n=1 Tax=Peronospora matthiolae TaxID=2874970 RepID=A0AAV1UFJ6_9STRA
MAFRVASAATLMGSGAVSADERVARAARSNGAKPHVVRTVATHTDGTVGVGFVGKLEIRTSVS